MEPDDLEFDTWLSEANRDLVASTAEEIDVEAMLTRVKQREALVLGGTGMLANVAAALLDEGWHVVLPSRRRPGFPATDGHSGTAHWVKADWADPTALVEAAGAVLHKPAELLVAWVHREVRTGVLRAVAPLLAPGAPVIEVHSSASANPVGGCPDPVLSEHPTQQVVLGYVRHEGRTRWLTHQEISSYVLDAVRRALIGEPSQVHQGGEFRAAHDQAASRAVPERPPAR